MSAVAPGEGARARSVAPEFLAPTEGGGWELLGRRCGSCTEALFGRADRFCPACGAEALTDVAFGGRGTVWSYTVLRNAPPGPRRADDPELPCPLALVELDDAALRVSAPLAVPLDRLRIGLPVELDPRRLSAGSSGGSSADVTAEVSDGGSDGAGGPVFGIRFREVRG